MGVPAGESISLDRSNKQKIEEEKAASQTADNKPAPVGDSLCVLTAMWSFSHCLFFLALPPLKRRTPA